MTLPRTYEKIAPGGHKIYDRMLAIRDRYHGALTETGVVIDLLLAHAARDKNDDPTGAAVKHGGYPAAATIRIVNLKDRVAGLGDVQLIVDGDKWDEWTDAELDALLDHELTHIEIVIDKDGAVVRDDAGRPKLKLRLHDFQIGGFNSIAKKHKEDAFEVQSVAAVGKEFVAQAVFPGF